MSISVQMNSTPTPIQELIGPLASKRGPLNIYCWYEGVEGLPRTGAAFYKESIFDPLLKQKSDVFFNLYSLKGWDFVNSASNLSDSELGDAIERCNNAAFRCFYSSSFFQFYLALPQSNGLYRWAEEELEQKKWLRDLSERYDPKGKTVKELFENRPTIFDCIGSLDVSKAYSYLQYMEGYYLIRDAVTRALAERSDSLELLFLLPNDENKYYKDLPQDLELMLKADLGESLGNIKVDVAFTLFAYGKRPSARPYIDRSKNARSIRADELPFYLPLPKQGNKVEAVVNL